jgi:nucleoside-diphosphate-sugar epimerase
VFALVTGSTGFLGSHLVERLRAGGHRVRALARNPNKARVLTHMGAEVVCGDITSHESVVSAVRGVDVIFHAAALVTHWAPWSEFLAATVRGTENLLEAAACADVNRFVHVSTVRVYDDRHCRRQGVVTEDAPLGKRGFRHFGHYARAKVMAEAAVWRYRTRLPISVVRPAWIYGPRDEIIMPSLVRFLRSSDARWPSSTNPCADPIYVTDVADCMIAIALQPAAIGQAYNAAPQTRICVREFLGNLCEALGFQAQNRSVPYAVAVLATQASEWWTYVARHRSAPRYSRAGLAILTQDVRHDPAKAKCELGWRSKVDLRDGIALTAAWLRERYSDLSGARSYDRR